MKTYWKPLGFVVLAKIRRRYGCCDWTLGDGPIDSTLFENIIDGFGFDWFPQPKPSLLIDLTITGRNFNGSCTHDEYPFVWYATDLWTTICLPCQVGQFLNWEENSSFVFVLSFVHFLIVSGGFEREFIDQI